MKVRRLPLMQRPLPCNAYCTCKAHRHFTLLHLSGSSAMCRPSHNFSFHALHSISRSSIVATHDAPYHQYFVPESTSFNLST